MPGPKKRGHRRYRQRTPIHARLGQHFFTSGSVADRIIRSMDLRQNHSVLELGAGEGFFIWMTAPNVRSLTAIEIDPQLITRLNARFKDFEGIRVIRRGMTSTVKFGDYDVIFGNIPFNRSADVFKKISRPPVGFKFCYLIVQTEAAYRLLGSGRPTELAVLAYPFIDVRMGVNVPRWAYDPPASVDSIPLHAVAGQSPLVSRRNYPAFRTFVKTIIHSDIRKLSRVIGSHISYPRRRQICAQVNIETSDSHLALSMPQYVALFDAISTSQRSTDAQSPPLQTMSPVRPASC